MEAFNNNNNNFDSTNKFSKLRLIYISVLTLFILLIISCLLLIAFIRTETWTMNYEVVELENRKSELDKKIRLLRLKNNIAQHPERILQLAEENLFLTYPIMAYTYTCTIHSK